ncbi:tyrosinase family protein [Undibacterium sp. Di26W]|uniref:tyrosinase family protein n=1 Tax=Undibacterium sp. Di26W TaxID=3413035 RepID=UPI003BF40888
MNKREFLSLSAQCVALPLLLNSSQLWAAPVNLKVRRNLMTLPDSDPFFTQYAEAVKAMHALPTSDMRSWWGQATIHPNHCQHGTANFAVWHRPYLLMFENICAKLIGDPSFTLHYWDWSAKNGIIPNPFYDRQELDVTFWNDPGVYNGKNWGPVDSRPLRALARGIGVQSDPVRGGAFTTKNLENILKQTQFNNFTNMLEGQPHNTGHVVAGFPPSGKPGHIGDGLSPLDPIFWMHHTMVDFMWARWQKAGNVTQDQQQIYADMFVDADGKPITFNAKQVHDFEALGYTYDHFVNSSPLNFLSEAPFSNKFQEVLATQLKTTKPKSLAQLNSLVKVLANTPVALPVKVTSLLKELRESRVFRTTLGTQRRLASEGRRILAVLKQVSWPEGTQEGLMVNVFVNCPYLTPTTGNNDPHYAGSFSFFGSAQMTHQGGHHGYSIVVDITAPLLAQAAQGRLDERIQIQVVSIHPQAQGEASSVFQIKDVEVISV